MSGGTRSDETLRWAFAQHASRAPDEPCPSAEQLWGALHGELPTAERHAVIAHLAKCGACAEDWRLGMRGDRAEEADASRRFRRRLRRGAAWWAVAAASLLIVVAGFGLWRGMDVGREEVVTRTEPDALIEPRIADPAVLQRERAVLRWTDVAPSAVYSVEITGVDLAPLDSARELEQPRYRIPADQLAEVEAGETIAWRVEARLPDGRTVSSRAFLARIE